MQQGYFLARDLDIGARNLEARQLFAQLGLDFGEVERRAIARDYCGDDQLAALQEAFLAGEWANRTPVEVEVPFAATIAGVCPPAPRVIRVTTYPRVVVPAISATGPSSRAWRRPRARMT